MWFATNYELRLFSEIKMRTCWFLIVFYYTSSSWEIHETSALVRVSVLFNRLLKSWGFLEISCKKTLTLRQYSSNRNVNIPLEPGTFEFLDKKSSQKFRL